MADHAADVPAKAVGLPINKNLLNVEKVF